MPNTKVEKKTNKKIKRKVIKNEKKKSKKVFSEEKKLNKARKGSKKMLTDIKIKNNI
jgi:hypothetical protein